MPLLTTIVYPAADVALFCAAKTTRVVATSNTTAAGFRKLTYLGLTTHFSWLYSNPIYKTSGFLIDKSTNLSYSSLACFKYVDVHLFFGNTWFRCYINRVSCYASHHKLSEEIENRYYSDIFTQCREDTWYSVSPSSRWYWNNFICSLFVWIDQQLFGWLILSDHQCMMSRRHNSHPIAN